MLNPTVLISHQPDSNTLNVYLPAHAKTAPVADYLQTNHYSFAEMFTIQDSDISIYKYSFTSDEPLTLIRNEAQLTSKLRQNQIQYGYSD